MIFSQIIIRRVLPCTVFAVAILFQNGCATLTRLSQKEPAKLQLTETDRILILAPHPDDEVLGCAGIIQEAVSKNLPIRIVFFTNGDNNELSFLLYRMHPVVMPSAVQLMGEVRAREAVAAAKIFGLSETNLTFMGYPDFGTLRIWNAHWRDAKPYRAMLTRATQVIYTNALTPGAPFSGESVIKDLSLIFREFQPTRIFVSHPADANPDHMALYLFTQVALWDMDSEISPLLHPYLIHYPRWPVPNGFAPEKPLLAPDTFDDDIAWQTGPLESSDVDLKRKAVQAHRSQFNYSAKLLLSFVRCNELFGDYPVVDMTLKTDAGETSVEIDEPEERQAEQLTDEERDKYIGITERRMHVERNDLVITLKFTRPLTSMVQCSTFCFGYRKGQLFADQPKIRIDLGAAGIQCYDNEQKISRPAIKLSRRGKEFVFRIPLSSLGDPDFILTSTRIYMAQIPLDWMPWRTLKTKP